MRVPRDHTRQKRQILTDHLVQTSIRDVETQARARAEADLAKVSQPAAAGLQLGLHAGSPGPSVRRGHKSSLEQPERKGPQPGVAATFRPAPRRGRDPERCRAGASAADPPSPPVADCTAGSHTPCRGPELSRPRRRRAAAAARGVRYARPEAAGVTSGGR